MIATLQDLFSFILRHESTLIFGNLGRKPHVIYKFLTEQLPSVDVVVVSPHYQFPTSGDHRIRSIQPNALSSSIKCDLLIYAEPLPYSHVFDDKPAGAGRMVVLASHLMFTDKSVRPTLVAYFESISVVDTIGKTRHLLSLQDGSIRTNNVNHIRPSGSDDSLQVQILGDEASLAASPSSFEQGSKLYVVVDLTHHTSPFRLYLSFLDAFDAMLRNVESIGRWIVGFPERHGSKAFEQLTQDVIDKLYCLKFEHGNLVSLSADPNSQMKMFLSILPFYKSGVIDTKTFNVPIDTFCGIDYTASETSEEVFKAGAKHNLEHWTGSVFRIL